MNEAQQRRVRELVERLGVDIPDEAIIEGLVEGTGYASGDPSRGEPEEHVALIFQTEGTDAGLHAACGPRKSCEEQVQRYLDASVVPGLEPHENAGYLFQSCCMQTPEQGFCWFDMHTDETDTKNKVLSVALARAEGRTQVVEEGMLWLTLRSELRMLRW